MNEVTEVLRAARDLLSEPGAWTPRSLARDAKNRSVEPESDEAVTWCAVGALRKAANRQKALADQAREVVCDVLEREGFERHLPDYNDRPGGILDDVLGLFAKAIKHSEDPAS